MLCVYDKLTRQDGFNNCGLGILRPSKMQTFEEENGDYSLTLEYPMTSDDTMWRCLTPYNIIKNSEGQLFPIHTCGTEYRSGQAVWKAEASHISYYLADKIVENCKPDYWVDCHDALNEIWNHTKKWSGSDPFPEAAEYNFTFSSDRRNDFATWIDYNNVSTLSALLGTENSIASLYDCSIHRDNFHVSMNKRKGSDGDIAFSIIHGINMIDIRERICAKDNVTYTRGSDNFGNTQALWGGLGTAPHEILKHFDFSYSSQVDNNMQRLRDDVEKYNAAHLNKFDVSYEVKFKDLRNIEKYKEWAKLQSYHIGDIGIIKSERLGIEVRTRIVSRTVNDITGETESITLGNFTPSLWKNDRFGMFSTNKRLKALEKSGFKLFVWEAD